MEFYTRGGSDHFPQLSAKKKWLFFQNCQNNESLQVTKLPPYFWAKIMKITTQKLKVTPLIFNKNFENNESKMVFPQKQGGGVRSLWKIPQNKMVFFLKLPSVKSFKGSPWQLMNTHYLLKRNCWKHKTLCCKNLWNNLHSKLIANFNAFRSI